MGGRYWQDLTTTDFQELDPSAAIALFPVAATEQHGPHLPLSTDTLINEAVVSAALERLPERAMILVLPTMAAGASLEHTSFPGTLSLAAETVLSVWTAVGESVSRAGVRKLVIFNTHGGQTGLVDVAALRLRAELGMLVVRASYFAFGMPPGLFDEKELVNDLHGGEIETSLMLHLHPDLVRRDALRDFSGLPAAMAARNEMLGVERPVGFGWMSQDLDPSGACGNAANADAGRGARYLEHLAGRLAALLTEVAETPLSVIDGG